LEIAAHSNFCSILGNKIKNWYVVCSANTVVFGMLAYFYYKLVVLKRCLPVASWGVTVARSVALGVSEEKHVIKVRYTFVFTQRCNMSAVKQGVTLY
jgi:hypothetical protein